AQDGLGRHDAGAMGQHWRSRRARPIGGGAQRADRVHVVAGSQLEANEVPRRGARRHELAAAATAERREVNLIGGADRGEGADRLWAAAARATGSRRWG